MQGFFGNTTPSRDPFQKPRTWNTYPGNRNTSEGGVEVEYAEKYDLYEGGKAVEGATDDFDGEIIINGNDYPYGWIATVLTVDEIMVRMMPFDGLPFYDTSHVGYFHPQEYHWVILVLNGMTYFTTITDEVGAPVFFVLTERSEGVFDLEERKRC